MELQQASAELERAGVYVAAISYDPVGAIAQFCAEHAITYDFLADEGSRFIRELGILNTLVQPDESVYGIPYPGSYFLDEQGVVVAKVFHREYQLREAASYLLSEAFGIQPDLDSFPGTSVAAPDVELSAQLGAPDLKFAQVVALYVRLALPDGLHVSAPDAPEGFIPTSVRVTTDGPVDVGTPRFPASHAFRLEGLKEELRVLDGVIVVAVPLTLRGRDLEAVDLAIGVEYQACNDRECFLPQRATMQLRVPVGALNRPPRRDA